MELVFGDFRVSFMLLLWLTDVIRGLTVDCLFVAGILLQILLCRQENLLVGDV